MGKASSTTRYSVTSAFTKGAEMEPVALVEMVMSATPQSVSSRATFSEGYGVILSIMVHGKLTVFSSLIHRRNASETKPCSAHAAAMARQLSRSFFPFCAQLSMLTNATGVPPAKKRQCSSDTTMDSVCRGLSGPAERSVCTTGSS